MIKFLVVFTTLFPAIGYLVYDVIFKLLNPANPGFFNVAFGMSGGLVFVLLIIYTIYEWSKDYSF